MEEKKQKRIVPILAEIGIMAALGFVLDELQSSYSRGLFVAGGSIGFAMVCVILVGYRRGFWAALITGFVMSFLDVLTGPYILPGSFWRAFVQVGLDYVIAYPVVALCCVFKPAFDASDSKNKKALFLILGCVFGGLLKYMVHNTAGIIFYSDPDSFAWGLSWMNPVLYVFLYNGAYMIPCIILTTMVCLLLLLKAPNLFDDPDHIYRKIKMEEKQL